MKPIFLRWDENITYIVPLRAHLIPMTITSMTFQETLKKIKHYLSSEHDM